jgi:hypothetical protein
MTAVDVESKFEQKIRQAGLLPFFSADESHFLDLEGDLFVEIVARDSTKLPEFGRIAEEVKAENPSVNAVVRAHWEVEEIGDPVQATNLETGTPWFGELYQVTLKSGRGTARIWVEVTTLASRLLRGRGFDSDAIRRVIHDFVSKQLKIGGSSYWDPIRSPQLEISGDAAEHIVSKRSAKQ